MRAARQRSQPRSALTQPDPSGRHRVAGLLPRLHATTERLGPCEPHRLEPLRLTGGRRLVRSGAVEDQLLALGHALESPLQVVQRDRPLQPQPLTLALVVVRTHEQRPPPRHISPRLLRTDPLDALPLRLAAPLRPPMLLGVSTAL